MHELSLAQKVIEIALEAASGRKIKGINLIIGNYSSVSPESLFFYLETLTTGTILEGAQFSYEKVEAEFRCSKCGNYFIGSIELICPYCGATEGEYIKGREFYLESIEVEDEDCG